MFLIVFLIALYRNLSKRSVTCKALKQRNESSKVAHVESKNNEAHLLAPEEAFEEIQTSEIEEAQERELIDSNNYFNYLYECIEELENVKTKSGDREIDTQLNYKVKQCNLWENCFSDTKKQIYARMLARLNGLFSEIYSFEK